jgi:hypothetical protein
MAAERRLVDALFAAAAALLPAANQPTVTVVPIEVGRSSQVLVAMARWSCAFVKEVGARGDLREPRLSARTRGEARRSRRPDGVGLAATIAHEHAHVTGADEPQALQKLIRKAPCG